MKMSFQKLLWTVFLRFIKTLVQGYWKVLMKNACFMSYQKQNLVIERQKPLPLFYETIKMEIGYRLDFLIDNKVVIEVKAVEALNDVHKAQVITYLKLSGTKLALLVNFNVVLIKDGIKRIVNNL